MSNPRVRLLPGDTVFFRCTNPDVGIVKRVARDGSWAVVDWRHNKTKKCPRDHLILLNPVLNGYLVGKGLVEWSISLQMDLPDRK